MNAFSSSALRDLLGARYRELQPACDMAGNDVLLNLLDHRSVRDYLPDPVAEEVLGAAIAAAQSASSSSNLQLWSVIAVTDPARKSRLAALAGNQRHIEQAPLFLAWVLDLSRLRQLGESRHLPVEGLNYLETFVVGAVDTALAAQNAAVAVESFGMGVVYIGGMRNHPESVAEELGLPPSSMVLFGMCIGRPEPSQRPAIKPRLPQAAVLHRERYDAAGQSGQVAEYDEQIVAYLRERGASGKPWSDTALERVRSPASLNGRDRLREALAALGFALK